MLRGLNFCHGYIDDLLVAPIDEEEHRRHLEQIFQRLKERGLSINVAKNKFAEEEVEYLRYTVNRKGIRPTTDRIKAVNNFKKPDNISELRRYLGIINFYHRFIKDAAAVLVPLNKYLVGAKKRDRRPIEWTVQTEEAFQESKKRL